ncbi:MAG: hypothetical protein ACO2PM_19135, partial [Pyrobaculum sp.]
MYVTTAWIPSDVWALLQAVKEVVGYWRDAEVVRQAIFTAAVEDSQGRPLVSPEELFRAFPELREAVERYVAQFSAQVGKLREVAVRLPAAAPLQRIKKALRERWGVRAPNGMAVEHALSTYLAVRMKKPAGLPEPVLGMLTQVYAKVKSAPRSEKKAVALNELKLRLGTAKELVKALGLPVDRWWESIIEEAAAGDPEAVLRRYVEGGEVPRVRASDRFAEAASLVLKEARDAEGLRRLWWVKRGLLLRAAENKAEKEIVKMIDAYVERDPETALKVLKAVERGERPPPPPPPPFDRAGFYAAVKSRLDTFDQIARRILERARDVGLPHALYGAGEYFRGFVRTAERDLKTVLEKAPPEEKEEDELRQKIEAALDAALAVAAAGAAAGGGGGEVAEPTETAVQKVPGYCRQDLGPAEKRPSPPN